MLFQCIALCFVSLCGNVSNLKLYCCALCFFILAIGAFNKIKSNMVTNTIYICMYLINKKVNSIAILFFMHLNK